MRPDWTKGSNYDPARLAVYTNDSGFILGLSKLGDKLGVDGADVLLPATSFTSISISTGTNIENGLFVQREVETCSLTATLPAHINLKNKRLSIKYDSVLIYKGTVREVSWTETMDDRYWLPGNTATKTYEVSLLLTSGEEAWSDAKAPARLFTIETIENRFIGLLGIDCDGTNKDPAADINPNAYGNVYHSLITYNRGVTTGEENLVDVLRNYTKLVNMHYVYKPWDEIVELRNNAAWHSGTTEATALVFSDNAAHDTQTAGSDTYIHEDRYVMYSSRTFEEQSGYYQGSARVQTKYEFDANPTVFGPFRTSEIAPSDTLIDLGEQKDPLLGGDAGNHSNELARNYVATLPLKTSSVAFSKSITMPLQSYNQIENIQVPGMALLEHDGVTERVAVLGMSQSITPNGWFVTYELGPHHLLDRYSDLDPSPPTNGSAVQVGANVTVSWKTPLNLPTDTALYWYVFTANSSLNDGHLNTTSWSSDMSIPAHGSAIGQAPGDSQSTTFPKPSAGFYTYKIAYTSDPAPGSGVPTVVTRQGQPFIAAPINVS